MGRNRLFAVGSDSAVRRPAWASADLDFVMRGQDSHKSDHGVHFSSEDVANWTSEDDDLAGSVRVWIEGFRHDPGGRPNYPDVIRVAHDSPAFQCDLSLTVGDARRLLDALKVACALAETDPCAPDLSLSAVNGNARPVRAGADVVESNDFAVGRVGLEPTTDGL